MIILQDTREQMPFDFSRFPDVAVVRETLPTGDYSLPGFTSGAGSIALERKSLDDLVSCLMGANRERFEKELERAANTISLFSVVVEAGMNDVWTHKYRSRMEPKAVLASLNAFFIRYKTPFLFAGTRKAAEWATHDLLSKHFREIEERFKQAMKGA